MATVELIDAERRGLVPPAVLAPLDHRHCALRIGQDGEGWTANCAACGAAYTLADDEEGRLTLTQTAPSDGYCEDEFKHSGNWPD